jgi:CubicO group peptidase (beta-lactamase class C family)
MKGKWTRIGLVSTVVLLFLAWLLAPVYVFMGEDNASLFAPLGSYELEASDSLDSLAGSPRWQQQASAANQLLLDHRNAIGAPALSAAIAIDGELVWAAASGYADLSTGQAASTDTLFRIGSTSKAVTGSLMARLVDAGIVSLDSPISDYYPELPNPAWRDLSLRQLASHTAGIPGYENNNDWVGAYRSMWPRSHYENVADSLEVFDGSDMLFAPGEGFYYSSYDVVLQSAILQAAAGQPYQQLLGTWLRDPLGIETPIPEGPHADRASFYFKQDDRAYNSPGYDVSHRMAGGGLMARPRDLALLASAWTDPDFISDATREAFFTAQPLNNGEINEQAYGLNWRVREAVGEQLPLFNANHGGVGKGSMSWLLVIPEEKLALSMMINTRIDPFSDWISIQEELISLFLQ